MAVGKGQSMPETVTHTLEIPGGVLVYDVIAADADGQRYISKRSTSQPIHRHRNWV